MSNDTSPASAGVALISEYVENLDLLVNQERKTTELLDAIHARCPIAFNDVASRAWETIYPNESWSEYRFSKQLKTDPKFAALVNELASVASEGKQLRQRVIDIGRRVASMIGAGGRGDSARAIIELDGALGGGQIGEILLAAVATARTQALLYPLTAAVPVDPGVDGITARQQSTPIAARLAGQQYDEAVEKAGRQLTDDEAYQHVREHIATDLHELPRRETWKRYLRMYRKATETQKNTPRRQTRPSPGRSVVRATDIDHQGPR